MAHKFALKSMEYDDCSNRHTRNNVNVSDAITQYNIDKRRKIRKQRLRVDCATDLKARHTLQAAFKTWKATNKSRNRKKRIGFDCIKHLKACHTLQAAFKTYKIRKAIH